MAKSKVKEDSMLVEPTRVDEILNEEEYVNAVINGDILLPVYDGEKMIAQVQWRGNLSGIYGIDEILSGRGLLKLENHIILTEIWCSGIATAEIINEIFFTMIYLFLD